MFLIFTKKNQELRRLVKDWKKRYHDAQKHRESRISAIQASHAKEIKSLNKEVKKVLSRHANKILNLDKKRAEYENAKIELQNFQTKTALGIVKAKLIMEDAQRSVNRATRCNLDIENVKNESDLFIRKNDKRMGILK